MSEEMKFVLEFSWRGFVRKALRFSNSRKRVLIGERLSITSTVRRRSVSVRKLGGQWEETQLSSAKFLAERQTTSRAEFRWNRFEVKTLADVTDLVSVPIVYATHYYHVRLRQLHGSDSCGIIDRSTHVFKKSFGDCLSKASNNTVFTIIIRWKLERVLELDWSVQK